jgi:tetratricopeptide (TPR) repeat protein
LTDQVSFWGIFWVDADNKQSIDQGFAEIGRMQVPPLETTTPRDVTQWLATTKESWLLILDNCDDANIDFARYIPSKGGSMIITTRLTECRIHGTWENIDELGKEDATHLLLKASGLENGDLGALKAAAESVVSVLGQHALALVHAGAYIKRGYCTLSEYVHSFRDEQNRLLEFKPKQQTSRHGSVYTTFEVSAKALASSDGHDCHLALNLLNILAFLDREAVDEDVFINAFDECHRLEDQSVFVWEENEVQTFRHCAASCTEPESVAKHQSVPEKLDGSQDVSCNWRGGYRFTGENRVTGYDSIRTGPDQPMYQDRQESTVSVSEEGIVPDTFRDSTLLDCFGHPSIDHPSKASDSDMLSPDAVDVPGPGYDVNDDGEIDHLSIWHCDKIRSSGLVDRQKSTRLRAAIVRLAELSLIKVGNDKISMHPLVHEWARTRLDEMVRQSAWEQTLSVLALCSVDEWTPLTSKIVTHMKTCFRDRAEYRIQPHLSLNVVRALYKLAWTHKYARENEAALAIIEILSASYKIPPETWSFKSKILLRERAKCLGKLGRVEEMQSCMEQVLQSETQWYEPDSLEEFDTQMLLAQTYHAAGDFKSEVNLLEALNCYQGTTTFACGILRTKKLLQLLARVYRCLGEQERVVVLVSWEFEVSTKCYPLYHPAVLDNCRRLAESYIAVGVPGEAVKFLADFVRLKPEQTLIDDSWFGIMMVLAKAYKKLNMYDRAIPFYQGVYAHHSSTLLAEDPVRTRSMIDLARAYLKVNMPSQAATLFEEAVEIAISRRPHDDVERSIGMRGLAEAYAALDKLNQAARLLEQAVKIDRSMVPPDDKAQSISMNRLATIYLRLDRLSQAVPLLEEVFEIRTSRLSFDDPVRLMSMKKLAKAYVEFDKPSQAVPLLEGVLKISKLPQNEPVRLNMMFVLAELYLQLNKTNQAVTLLEEVVALDEDTKRLLAVRRLAHAYTDLRTSEKLNKAVFLLEEVMDKGRETSHANPEELPRTRCRLADAQKKLRQVHVERLPLESEEEQQSSEYFEEEQPPPESFEGGQQSLGDSEEGQLSLVVPGEGGIPNVAADITSDGTVYQNLRDLTKRAALMF